MHSIRTKITALVLAAILTSISLFGIIGTFAIMKETNHLSTSNMNMICENRTNSLDSILSSTEQSVNMITNIATDTLDADELKKGGVLGAQGDTVEEIPGRSAKQRKEMDAYFDKHLSEIELAFQSVANHTNGAATCYYRVNPELTSTAKGFYFAKDGQNEFRPLHLTMIENYDPNDLVHVGWYYIPLKAGKPTWLNPYHTANPGGWVLSYAIPMYKEDTFIGVLGMDISLDTLTKQIQKFTDFSTGYFVLADKEGMIYYHPNLRIEYEPVNAFPELIDTVKDFNKDTSADEIIRFDKNGTRWQMTYSTLKNGLKLVAVVKQSEINDASFTLTGTFLITGILLLLMFITVTLLSLNRIVSPLNTLTLAAKSMSQGDYNVNLEYKEDDEVGVLTEAFCSMRDRLKTSISELTENKEKLQNALTIAEQANSAKTKFLNKMSHEVRTPLNAIIGFTYLAEENIDNQEKVYDCIQKIDLSGKHLLTLVNEILDVSHTESEKNILKEESFSLKDLISQIDEVFESRCAQKDQIYSSHIIGKLNDNYIGDAIKLNELLGNVISNAVKYTPSGGMILFSVEQISEYNGMSTLRFIVKDNGIGISDEYLPKIFDAFSQENEGYSNQTGSTGLGLTITKSILQLMNGEISVQSTKGEGSEFTIVLTLRSPQNTSDPLPDEAAPSVNIAGLRVLVVEDMEVNAELLRDVLEMEDIESDWAENGQIAVNMFSESKDRYYDAILMDIRMPVMDGLQATKQIRKLKRPDAKTVPIIALTANAYKEDVQLSLQSGMNAHLSKPLDPEKLFEALEKETSRIVK